MKSLDISIAALLSRLEGHGQLADGAALAAPRMPRWWPAVATAAVFGPDTLSLHPDGLNFDDEFSKLFEFISPSELVSLWVGEDALVLDDYYPLANIDGGNWILFVQDSHDMAVAVIDHEEVFDADYVAYKKRASTQNLPEFLAHLNLQWVACFMHATDRSRYSMIEFHDGTLTTAKDYASSSCEFMQQPCSAEIAAEIYWRFASDHAREGYYVHYCPARFRSRMDAVFSA